LKFLKNFIKKEKDLEEFKILLDVSPAVVIRSDKKGYVIFANKAFEEIFGYHLDEALGKIHVKDLYKGGIEEAKNVMKILKRNKFGGVGKIKNFEVTGITRYGQEIPFVIYGSLLYEKNKEIGSIGFLFDISERKKLEEALKKEKDRFKSLLDNASEGIYIRKDHEFKYFNKKFRELLGYSEDELRKLPYTSIIDESVFEICSQYYQKILNGEKVKLPYESIFKRKDGTRIFVEININPVEWEDGIAIQGFVRDITEKKKLENKLKEVNKKLHELAIKDDLTGVFNQRFFREQLKLKYMESKRYKFPISLILIDIDNFKEINDTFGHLAGDFILKEVAEILRRNVRDSDIIARYGGDEFAIILPHADKEQAKKVAQRINCAIREKEFWYELNPIKITVSIGISTISKSIVKDEKELFKIADNALYKVKQKGKNDIIMEEDCGRVL